MATETKAKVSLVMPRLDAKPWGGRKLAEYGIPLPNDEPIGEALVTAGDAVVAAGDGEGMALQELVAEDPGGRLGLRGCEVVMDRATFPLLVKLIDAEENLSIQVHPDDAGARSLNRLGKTEAWHVLGTRQGGKLFLGLNDDVDAETFMEHARQLDGTSASDLRAIDAVTGMTVLIPAGTVHALGAGVMVYEVQQPSDVTFRLDDWGRVDADGNPREMHLEQGKSAIRADNRPTRIDPISLGDGGVRRHVLTACRYFATERFELSAKTTVTIEGVESPQVLTGLTGTARIGGSQTLVLMPGSSVVVWPSDATATLTATGNCVVLRSWVPDLMKDIIEPARAAGVSDEAIAALGGVSSDLAEALDGN